MFRRLLGSILFYCCAATWTVAAALPAEIVTALEAYRTEGPKGWAFTQSTTGDDRSRVESFDPLRAPHLQWTLVSENGKTPTESETNTYREQQTRRTGGETAPNVKQQLDRDSAELVSDDGVRAVWLFRLKPSDADDSSAEHMQATFTFHRPTSTFERVELASFEPFSPVFAVKVAAARTTIEYNLPNDTTPALMQKISVSVQGRAFWFRSLDSDLTVTYSDYRYAGKL